MTTPSVVGSITGKTDTETLVQKVIMPSGCSSGEMLVTIFSHKTSVAWDNTTAGAWTEARSVGASQAKTLVLWKISNGAESGLTLSVSMSLSSFASWKVWRVTNHASSLEVTSTSTQSVSLVFGTLAPSWGTLNSLYLLGASIANNPSITATPTDFSSTFTISSTASARNLFWGGEKGDTTATLIPTSIVIGTVQNYSTVLVAIKGTGTTLLLTSVSSDNNAYSAEVDTEVVGTGLSAGLSVTYKGVACTVLSASSSTSLKITFPDFFSNNIKLGVANEFKVNT